MLYVNNMMHVLYLVCYVLFLKVFGLTIDRNKQSSAQIARYGVCFIFHLLSSNILYII